jgi:hypothetical protein
VVLKSQIPGLEPGFGRSSHQMASATKQSPTDLPWVHHRSWREAWREVRPAQSGGQSSSKVVARIGDEATDTCFLKLLNRQKDPERRKRFFRETSALTTYSHPNIPRLVETDAFHYTDNEFKLYLPSLGIHCWPHNHRSAVPTRHFSFRPRLGFNHSTGRDRRLLPLPRWNSPRYQAG